MNKIMPYIKLLILYSFPFFMFFSTTKSLGQENPPIPVQVEVNTARWLNFGAFTTGATGGTVVVDQLGNRTQTGDVTLLNMGPTPSSALFDVTAIPGAIIQISAPVNVPLTGSNGGTIYLDIDSFSTGNVFIHNGNEDTPTPVEVGGTLKIGDPGANPPGKYNGTFTLTFINQ